MTIATCSACRVVGSVFCFPSESAMRSLAAPGSSRATWRTPSTLPVSCVVIAASGQLR